VFSSIGKWFSDKFTEVWENIKAVFYPVGTFFSDIWETIKQKFTDIGTRIGEAMGGAFKSAVNAVLRTVEGVVNAPINAINSLIGVINDVPGVSLGYLNTLSLPRLAQGGYVGPNQPQLALIGDNRREGEIVSPESKIRENVRAAVLETLGEMGGIAQAIALQIELLVRYEDGHVLIKKINTTQANAGRILLEV
jgi:hypothetical protein